MRRVIIRFLQNLEVEKNASPATIKAYQHDLKKFHGFLVQQMGDRFLPGDVSRDHIRNYMVWAEPPKPAEVKAEGASRDSGAEKNYGTFGTRRASQESRRLRTATLPVTPSRSLRRSAVSPEHCRPGRGSIRSAQRGPGPRTLSLPLT